MSTEMTTTPNGGAMIQQESQRAIAEVQAAMILARQFPRDEQDALDRMLVAFQRQGLAEQALYSYSKGGTEVTGPSIRSAEAIAQAWGNIQFGIRELKQENGESTVESFAWDIQTNVRQVKVFQVSHMRHTKQGAKRLTDSRDIYELVANQGARRLRACILGIIPADIVDSVVNQAEETLRAKADTSPEAIKKLVAAFEPFGVTADMIAKRIQRTLESITPAQVVAMRKVYNSLKDGMSKPADWFEVAEKDEPGAAAKSVMERFGFNGQEPKTETPAAPQKADDVTPDAGKQDDDAANFCPVCMKFEVGGACRNPGCEKYVAPPAE